ncbi:Eco57I restriction-modification methylase domain-containing protein [Fluviicola chungangensis]|uniref:site-specific DNA-methyltransferase (adenine-specific) n=1 Tax=Fluviicola chungangensis TaxID=2597671 RepID=A0A556MGP2_9FLAO|nr:Eco57I restriction-modification methylase domain-containing protein [Fluviicola chungangensis]TSJ38965.1 type I restriction endonuclease subunit M [Fluviicola chungangensis]
MDRKNTGSYYTPKYLADFVSRRVLSYIETKSNLSLLEPSVGDGAFIESLNNCDINSLKLTAIDINENELKIASKKWGKGKATFKNIDYLNFSTRTKFTAIIGNPPYVKKNRLSTQQIELSKEIHSQENLSEISVKNIWTTFLIKSNTLLKNDGVLAFILPSELLQVKFAEEIREYLKTQFERIEIFTFNDLMFECKGQDTIVLFAYKKSLDKGEFFTNIVDKQELVDDSFKLNSNNNLVSSRIKWTHHFLTSDELVFLDEVKSKLKLVNHYCESKPGIVTASNKFFIINKETEEKYNLSKYTKPIVQKGQFVNGNLVFSQKDFLNLENSTYPSRLLQLNNDDTISSDLKKYLLIGEELEIPKRYKSRIRNNWYVIPNISTVPEAFFFKRSHMYPKLLKNDSQALVTDSAYKIEMKEGFDLNSFIFSFYNSFTLLFSEIEGRYYGGGVLELTPSEFKKLPLPYLEINNEKFQDFAKAFNKKDNINQILDMNDFEILNGTIGLSKKDLEKIKNIRHKLIEKRTRK